LVWPAPTAERFDAARARVAHDLHLRRHRASSDARVLQLSIAEARDAGTTASEAPRAGGG
jgi:hypothetical protein